MIPILFFISTTFTVAITHEFQTNFDTSISMAKDEGKNVLMVFSGSDWCAPCIKFKQKILDSPSFKTYQEENLVVLYLDFPAKKKNQLSKEQKQHNEALAEQYNPSGRFPHVLLLDSEGIVVQNIDLTDKGAERFIERLKGSQ